MAFDALDDVILCLMQKVPRSRTAFSQATYLKWCGRRQHNLPRLVLVPFTQRGILKLQDVQDVRIKLDCLYNSYYIYFISRASLSLLAL